MSGNVGGVPPSTGRVDHHADHNTRAGKSKTVASSGSQEVSAKPLSTNIKPGHELNPIRYTRVENGDNAKVTVTVTHNVNKAELVANAQATFVKAGMLALHPERSAGNFREQEIDRSLETYQDLRRTLDTGQETAAPASTPESSLADRVKHQDTYRKAVSFMSAGGAAELRKHPEVLADYNRYFGKK